MDKKWFILHEGQVTGPFTVEEVEGQVTILDKPMVWGRGQKEWVSVDKWSKMSKEEVIGEPSSGGDRIWKIRVGQIETKPMSHDQMIEYLKKQTDYSKVQIWTEGYNEWKDIYQIHKIMDELGVSRRQHPRVPIMGTLQCEGTSNTFMARALSISEGGLGVVEAPEVKIGEKLRTILKSANLPAPVQATCEVVYVGSDGYAGLKFVSIQAEAVATIISYVKKFT
jgi:hypothetical protein